MPLQVVTGAVTTCTMAIGAGTFIATPKCVMSSYRDAGNIMDHKPMVNILPIGACTSLANPAVAAATTAAMGVLTPQPCIPNTPSPWVPGAATVLLAHFPALDDISFCPCMWGGMVKIAFAGQTTEVIP